MAGTDIFKAWMVEPCCCQMILDCDVELVRVEMVDTMQLLWFYMELFPYFIRQVQIIHNDNIFMSLPWTTLQLLMDQDTTEPSVN